MQTSTHWQPLCHFDEFKRDWWNKIYVSHKLYQFLCPDYLQKKNGILCENDKRPLASLQAKQFQCIRVKTNINKSLSVSLSLSLTRTHTRGGIHTHTHARTSEMLEGFIFYKSSINGKVNVALNKTKLLNCKTALSSWAYCIISLHQQVTIKFEFVEVLQYNLQHTHTQ